MILDTSAVVAVFLREPGWAALADRIADAQEVAIGAPTLSETAIVLTARLGRDSRALLADFLHRFGIAIIPFCEEHWREAAEAYRRFGRGRHRARLNFGDCLSYATARLSGQPLLSVGDDFPKTDLLLA